jgi:hypothetical protein
LDSDPLYVLILFILPDISTVDIPNKMRDNMIMKHYYERKVIEFSSSDEIEILASEYPEYKYVGYIPWGSLNYLILEKEYLGE